MTFTELNLKIDRTRRGVTRADQMHFREALRYLRDERLGILCGNGMPTEDDIAIVDAQLFPSSPQKEML